MGKLIEAIENGTYSDVGWEKYPAYYDFLKFGNKLDEEEYNLPEIWFKNAEINLKWLAENKDRILGSVYDLPDYKDKAVVFVGASPILKKTWHHLKNLGDDFIVVAVNSSVKYLLDHGIKPHYVVCIDGVQGKSWSLDLGKQTEDIIGIFSAYVAPKALRVWSGKIMIVPYTHKGSKYAKTTAKVRRKWGKGVPSGGNALNAGVSIFIMCTEAKIMLLAGNELSFKRNYYAGGKSDNDKLPCYFTKDVKGKKTKTLTPLWSYKVWLETNFEALSPPYIFYNCSEGILGIGPDGKLLPFIKQYDLGDAISEVKNAFEFEKLPWDKKSERVYEILYKDDLVGKKGYCLGKTSTGIWKFVKDEMPTFKKGLDVGCGKGLGVRDLVNEGMDVYGIDIAPSLKEWWKEIGIGDRCQIASAHQMPFKDNEFDLVVSTETLEHIPLEAIDDVLKEIYRVGSDKFLFTISKVPDARSGIWLHLLVKPSEWWETKLEQHGFEVIYSIDRIAPNMADKFWSCFICAVKDKKPYEDEVKKFVISDTEYPVFVPFGKGNVDWRDK